MLSPSHRDLGPIRGEVALLFGHMAALPKGRAARAFDPARDIQKGNLVAILMDDQDAAEWGRRFDIALVVGVTPTSVDGKVLFTVICYDCDNHIIIMSTRNIAPRGALPTSKARGPNWMGGGQRGPPLERSIRTTCFVKHGWRSMASVGGGCMLNTGSE